MTGRDAENTALKTFCVPGTFFSSAWFFFCMNILYECSLFHPDNNSVCWLDPLQTPLYR